MPPIQSGLGNVNPMGQELSGGGGGRVAAAMAAATNIINNATAFSERSCCFKLLGYDNIMVSSNLRLILIKVNPLPSWETYSPLNQDIKFHAITQALCIIDANAQDKKSFECTRQKQSLAPITTRRG